MKDDMFRRLNFNHLAASLMLKAPICSKVYETHAGGLGRGATSYHWLEAQPVDRSRKTFTLSERESYRGFSVWAGKTWTVHNSKKVDNAAAGGIFTLEEIRERIASFETEMAAKAPQGQNHASFVAYETRLHKDHGAFKRYQLGSCIEPIISDQKENEIFRKNFCARILSGRI